MQPSKNSGQAVVRRRTLAAFTAGAALLVGGLAFAGFPDAQYLMPLDDTPWDAAKATCEADGKVLCPRADACPSGQPVHGRPQGDVWMAVGDHPNAWVSIGTAYDERLCKLHEDVSGSAPGWGTTTGPMAVTGMPAALLCCKPPGVGQDGAYWGPVAQDSKMRCNKTRAIYSAVLMGIPYGNSWEESCAVMPVPALPAGSPAGQTTRCVNAMGVHMWGEWDGPETRYCQANFEASK